MKKYPINVRQAVPALIMFLIPLGLVLLVFTGGCQQVGPTAKFDRTTSDLATGTPNVTDIQDDTMRATISSTGTGGFISQSAEETQAFYNGTNPRNVRVDLLPDGTRRINLAGGSDFNAEGVEWTASTGDFKASKLTLSSSEPIRATNEALDRLVTYWTALSADQRAARIAELEAASKAGDTFAPVILSLIKAAAGVP